MNDLAEKALVGLEVAYRAARRHALIAVSIAGFAVSSVIVVGGSRVGAARATRPLTTWLGLQDTHNVEVNDPFPATLLLAGIGALILLWIVTVELVRRREVPESGVWAIVAAWGLPLAVGPPLFDTSIYSHVAFGLLQRDGHDPYTSAADHLGFQPIVEAIDPNSRGLGSAAGPVGSLIEHLSVSVAGGSPLGAVILWRALGLLSVIWIGRLAADMGGNRPARAVSLTALNPFVLLLVVSAAHVQGLAAALVLRSIAAANRRHWASAIVLACVAGSLVPASFVVVPLVVAVHLRGRRAVSARRVLARDGATAVVTIGALGFATANGFAWVRTAQDQFATHTPFAVTEAAARALALVVRPASYDDLTASSRVAAIVAMICVLGYLTVTAGSRALERSAGYALLTVALLAPVLAPWYLLGGVLCIAPSANAERKIWAMALSCAGCVLLSGGFDEQTTNIATGSGLVIVAVVTGISLRRVSSRADVGERTNAQP